MDKVRLSSGHLMPVLGLGTWQAASEVVTGAVLSALNTGYRHIDTAYNYRNEEAIGSAIEQWLKVSGNSRDALFVTTKLPHIGNRSSDVEKYLNRSLERLKLTYVDLYLVHMPFTFVPDETGDGPEKDDTGAVLLEESDHLAVWREMEKQVLNGKTRSIGLSNFNSAQIERICKADSTTILPSCLQVEMHAALQQKFLTQFCKERNIVITAFSPLGSPGAKKHFHDKYKFRIDPPDVLHSDIVSNLARKHQRTPAQILLRHLVQLGAVVIPKSVTPARIDENSKIFDFELTNEDMEEMGKLDAGTEGRILNFLFFKGVENHPEYPFPEEIRR